MKTRNDLPKFLREQGLMGVGVEVGVLKGEFSNFILSNWAGEKLYLIDAWRQFLETEYDDFANIDHNGQLNNFAHTFMSVYKFKERAVIIRDLSVSASKLFTDKSLDFVYLDAAHDYKSVVVDLKAWWPKIKLGGLMMGDDYVRGYEMAGRVINFGVIEAVNEFFGKDKINLTETIENEIIAPDWWILKQRI